MSKLPRITSNRSSNKNTEVESLNGVQSPQTNEIIEEQNLILPNINQENDIIKNPLVINTKINQLETKLLTLEKNYESVFNKITQDELKIDYLENKQNNINQNNIPYSPTLTEQTPSTIERNIGILNNKIKYIEQMLKSDQEIRVSEKKKELDFNKILLNKINTSLTNMIQLEVEQRFKTNLMQKNSNMKEIDAIQRQINNLKTQYEQMQTNLVKKIEDNNNECSERNQNLAKYIDVRLDDERIFRDAKELKKIFEKLTEEIKNNMNNQKNTNEYIENKIKRVEEKLNNSIKETYDFLGKIEVRLSNKLKYLKKYFEINILNNNNLMESNVKSTVKDIERNMAYLAEELVSTQNHTVIEFQSIHKSMKFQNKAILSDLENLMKHQTQLENILINRFKELENINKNFVNKIALFESKLDVSLTNEKILRSCQNDKIKKDLEDVSGNVKNSNNVLFTDLNKLIQESKIKNDNIDKQFKKIEDNLVKNNNNISQIEVDLNETVTKIILNEITQKAVEEKVTGELNRIKLFERSISNNREDINKLNDRIVDAFKSLGGISKQGDKINDMINEKEMRDDVEKLMMKMLQECSIMQAKEETMYEINNLSNRINKNNDKQENKIIEVKNDINGINDVINKNDEKIKILEENINNSITNSNINKSIAQMFTNVEIDNLYENINTLNNNKNNSKIDDSIIEKIIKQIEENNEVTKKTLANYSDIIDNKVNKTLEKVKQDNLDMWTNSISLGQKMNSPEEIKKLIKEIPPVIMPLDETLQKIMDLTFKYQNPEPFIPDLYENEKKIDEDNFGKIILEKKNKENENEKGSEKESVKSKEKKETEKSSDKSKNTKNSNKSKK